MCHYKQILSTFVKELLSMGGGKGRLRGYVTFCKVCKDLFLLTVST